MPAQFRMNLGLTPPAIQLIGSDGVARFDSRDKLLRCTNVIKGTQTFAARNTPINATNVYTLGSCAAEATFALGYMRTTSVSFGTAALNPFPDTGEWWFMSGTFVGWPSPFASGGHDAVAYTLLCSGGSVTLEEQLAIYEIKNEFGQTFQFGGYTLEYEVWACTFV